LGWDADPPLAEFYESYYINTIPSNEDLMITLKQNAAPANKLFSDITLELFFDSHRDDGNLVIATREEVLGWLSNQVIAITKDIARGNFGPEDMAAMATTVSDYAKDLAALAALEDEYELVVFDDGRYLIIGG
jgi:hypothetical protein